MIETPQSILAPDGSAALRALVGAGGGRVRGAHFGTYDYTALCGITASWQHMRHPVCDFAKHMMQVALAQTGVGCPTAPPTSCRSAPGGRRPRSRGQVARTARRPPRLAGPLRRCHALAGERVPPGLGSPPGPAPSRYAARLRLFPCGVAGRDGAPAQLRREGRAGHARRRSLRRRRDRTGPAEFLRSED